MTLKSSSVQIAEGSAFDAYSYITTFTSYKGITLNKKKNIVVTGTVNTKKPGVYTITYKAQQGKKTYTAVTKKLKVTVKAPAPQTTTPPTTKPEQTTKPEATTPEQTTQPEATTPDQTAQPETTTPPQEETTSAEEPTANV